MTKRQELINQIELLAREKGVVLTPDALWKRDTPNLRLVKLNLELAKKRS